MRSRSSDGIPGPSSIISISASSPSRQACRSIRLPGGAYLAALSSRLNSTCSNSIASSRSIGRSAASAMSTRCRARISPERRADDLAEIEEIEAQLDRAGFQAGHIKQIADEAVEALRLVMQCREQFVAFAGGVSVGVAAQARHGP